MRALRSRRFSYLALIQTGHHATQARSQAFQRARDLANFVRALKFERHGKLSFANSLGVIDEHNEGTMQRLRDVNKYSHRADKHGENRRADRRYRAPALGFDRSAPKPQTNESTFTLPTRLAMS